MDFEIYLKKNAQKIEVELDKILTQFLKQVKKTNPKLMPFATKFVKSCQGGKRIRGVLVKLGYELAGTHLPGEAKAAPSTHLESEIINVGAAFEILHTALLIHDDIIDQSPRRRGRKSLYQALGGNHYGISQAISLGDIGLYLPIKIITETNFPEHNKLKTINYFTQLLINTAWGQIMDIEPDKDITFVNLFKTAKYTIAGPLQIGAILTGADNRLVKSLGQFGERAGIAFQIKDDILDGESDNKLQVSVYASAAKKLIPRITKNKEMVKLLKTMSDYLVERTH